jgi:hypothetical protein
VLLERHRLTSAAGVTAWDDLLLLGDEAEFAAIA